jgi:hypothetical protein
MSDMLTLMVAALVTISTAAQKQLPAPSDTTSSSSGKSVAGTISAGGMALRQAAALGYTLNTFHTGRWNVTKAIDFPHVKHQRGADAGPWNAPKAIDWQNTGAIGFQWYLNKAFGGKPTPPSRLTVNRDGSLTLNGGEINTFSAPTSHGVGFGGGAYFEATFSFDPQSVVGNLQKTWPAWWAMSLEHFLNLPGQHWTGQPSNVMHFAEMDFFEYDTWNWAGQNTYGGATHDWGGTYESKKGWQYNYHNDKFVIRLPKDIDFTKPHRYGYLWVPATATSQGYAHYYFDGLPTTDKVTWSFYNLENPPPPPAATAPWKFGINDCQHMALILGTGMNQPMTIYSVDVWQASLKANIKR